ncbi:hypothetical protein GPECTOR_350g101 [Gonium pectorale]|uniref:Pesticidal crystal protein Cry22Aa Ig-like domain-containing protein n=1 Tax=Gonium pectorale TaxID=33097 RepID=A0A150FVM3_GONPE|nr:hypothetical protein GPECTOR_350g101 [Gonium pectorale]|eukprot:KXZ41637.1 hypothetical protein GPECTOR_350g101 [Gonium pectorale]
MNLTVVLRTRVPFNSSASQVWTTGILAPTQPGSSAAPAVVPIGTLHPWRFFNGEYQWRLAVSGTELQKAGNYTLFVFFGGANSINPGPRVWRNGTTVTVYPGPPAASKSALQVGPLSNTTAVGDQVSLELALFDTFGNPTLGAINTSVALVGNASRRTVVPGTNFTAAGAGRFRYVHTLEAQEKLTATLTVSGAVANSVSLNVSAASPAAVAFAPSLAGATVQLYGSSLRLAASPGAVLQGLALATHRLFVPVLRPTGRSFGGDPGLLATAAITGGNGTKLAFNGIWSGANRAYEVFFRVPTTGLHQMVVTLRHPAVQTAQASVSVALNATQPLLPVNGSLELSATQTRVGDWVFLTATLLDFTGQAAPISAGAVLLARSGSSRTAVELPLVAVADGARLWRARYDLRTQEVVAFELSVGGTLVDTKTISVAGIAPGFLDLPRSLADARMTNVLSGSGLSNSTTTGSSGSSSGGTVLSAAVASGAAISVAMGQQVTIELPVYTQSGARWLSDPGLSVVLSLVPSALEDDITTTYAASLQASVRRLLRLVGAANGLEPDAAATRGSAARRAGRELLAAGSYYDSAYNASYSSSYGSSYGQAYDYPSYTGEFTGDNAAGAGVDLDAYAQGDEPKDPWAPGQVVAPTPPLNSDTPDGLSALQDNLTSTPGVITFRGSFSTFKQSYQVSVWLGVSDTYMALLSVRHPLWTGSLRLTRFLLTAMDRSALRSTVDDTRFVSSVNPLITLNVRMPAVSLSSYPGGASSLLANYRSLLAGRAGVSSTDNVRVWDLRVVPAAGNGSSGVLIISQIWFDSDWASRTSGFSSMSSLEYFYFRLKNMPQPLLTDAANYPAFNTAGIQVTNVSLSEPFASNLAASTTVSDVAGSSSTKAITIIPMDLDSDPAATAATATPIIAVPAATMASPPVITLVGEPYVEVQEPNNFTDPGAYVFDKVDGFGMDVRVAVRVCVRRKDVSALMYALNLAASANSAAGGGAVAGATVSAAAAAAAQVAPPPVFACSTANNSSANSTSNSTTGTGSDGNSTVLVYVGGSFSLNASAINASSQVYLLTYTAVNSRRLTATPRYRAVVVQARCNAAAGEFWCASLSACSVGRMCSAGLAAVSKVLAATSSASASSTVSGDAAASATAAAAAVAAAGSTPVAVVTTFSGGIAVVSSDGTTTVVDPMSFTRTSFAPSDSSDPNNYGLLGSLMAASSSSSAVMTSQPTYVRDTLPPVISMLGNGAPAVSSTGQAVMLDTVIVGSNWTDPGATATDATDGNLTSLLQAYGSAAVDTSRPTPPGSAYSYMVEYQVSDLSGNVALPARRLIALVCAPTERNCTDASGLPSCTRNGMCGSADLINALDLNSNSTSGSSSLAPTGSSSLTPTAAALTLTLVGPREVRVVQGTPYDRCSSQVPKDQPCDPGAVAVDSREGSLDLRVRVCGAPFRATRAGQTLLPLALACNASTSTPGTYTLDFTVANSAGVTSSATRILTVTPACPVGEQLCPDNATCSTGGGVCTSSLFSSDLTTASPAPAASTTTAAASGRPTVSLVTATAAPSLVLLRRGSAYTPCAADADLSAASTAPCEPGALAWSADGVNMTDRVVVCPPADCLHNGGGSTGCSADLLRRHTLAAKGLAGCNLNTLAPPGAVFYLDFWVWDDARPPANATARRTVVITEPCPEATLPFFCPDNAGGYLCSPSPCTATLAFLPPVTAAPTITLLPPGSSTVYVEFGAVPPVYLGPCASGDSTFGCGAVASGAVLPTSPSGAVTTQDLTASLAVASTTVCTPAPGGTGCLPCSLEALAVAGSCLPGVYTFRYAVTDEAGRVATVDRTVVVYQRATISARLTLLPNGLTDDVAADELLAHLRNTSSTDYADALQNVTARMSAFGVRPSDIDITAAAVTPATPPPSTATPASLTVDVVIYIYNPPAVHRSALNGAATVGGRRRLAGAPAPAPAPAPAVSSDARPSEDSINRIWDRLAQQRWLELRRMQRQAVRLGAGLSDAEFMSGMGAGIGPEDAAGGDYGDAGMPGGAPGGRAALRMLQANTTASGDSTASAAALEALVASVSTSLNATSVSATLPPPPDLSVSYAAAMASLAMALAQSAVDMSADLATLSSSIENIMGAQADRAEAQRTAAQQDAFEALLAAAGAAENATLSRTDQVAALLDAQLAAQASLAAQAAELELTLTELSADARAQTDRAIYTAMAIADATGKDGDLEASTGCYRLNQNGFSVSFTISSFSAPVTASSVDSANASSSASGVTGGRRHLLQTSSRGGSGGSSGGGSSSFSGGYTILPWLGYYITHGYGGTSLSPGVDLSDAAASMRPRHAGARAGNRVVGGMLLHTTRRPLWSPSEVTPSSAASTRAAEAPCGGGFSDLDARCHLYELAYFKESDEAAAQLQRLFGGVNNSVAPYGVDPVFLRSSSLYRADLASKLSWYYNTSDSTQVGPTGTPYGFTARALEGRPPGFPVLLEGGLSFGRAVDMVRYLMDGNYLDRRQTSDMSAELLVYNPVVKAFAYFRGDFSWGETGGINGRFSTVGFPAMSYLNEGQHLADAMPTIFAHELLPLWILSIFFAVVTAIAVVNAAARAARHAAVAVAAAAADREADVAAAKGFGDGAGAGGKFMPHGDVAGAIPWAESGAGPAFQVTHNEQRELRQERAELRGLAGMSARRAWFREFVRHDGGLLYDVPLAVLLIAVAAFWTAFVDRHLVLYNARSSYRVYDAAASSSGRWLMSARSEVGVSEAASSTSSSLYTAASSLGLSVPTSPGDPGRWLLGADDSDWDDLNGVLREAHRLVTLWTVYGMLQAVVIVALIAKLVGSMSFQARLGIICRSLMSIAGPIFHLALLILLVVSMLAAASSTVLGERVGAVSTWLGALVDTISLMVGGGGQLDSSRVLAQGRIVPVPERVASAAILAVQVALMLFVLFNFFFATMTYIFLKQKRAVDWRRASTVPEDLARVVLPDMARRLLAMMPGATGRRNRRLLAAAAAARRAAAAKPAADSGGAAAAMDATGAGSAGNGSGLGSPTNKELLRSLAVGGVDELMCATDLPKTWNGRVRAARVQGGSRLIDKATMRRLMVDAATAAAAAKLPADDDKATAETALQNRDLALTAANRVMARVGRTYGAQSREYRVLEQAAEAEAARRRRQDGGGDGGAEEEEEPESPAAPAPPRRSLSTEIQIHLSIYDALHAAVESIVRWQSGVHRWQVRTWKQMASAYLFNQQLLAGLGMAPGPAFVERPQALQDEDLPHVPRVQPDTIPAGREGGQPAEAGNGAGPAVSSGSGVSMVMPPWMRVSIPEPSARSGGQLISAQHTPGRTGSMVEDISGILSPSQLSVTEAAGMRRKGSDGASSPAPDSSRRRVSSPAVHPYPQAPSRLSSPPGAPLQQRQASGSPSSGSRSGSRPGSRPQSTPPDQQRMAPTSNVWAGRQTALLDDGVAAAEAAAKHTPSDVEELGEAELAAMMNAASMPVLASPWKPLSNTGYQQTVQTAAAAAAAAAASVVAVSPARQSGGGDRSSGGGVAVVPLSPVRRPGSATEVHLAGPPMAAMTAGFTRLTSAAEAAAAEATGMVNKGMPWNPKPRSGEPSPGPSPPLQPQRLPPTAMVANKRSYSYAPTNIGVVPEEETTEGGEAPVPHHTPLARLRVASDVGPGLRLPPQQRSGGGAVVDDMRDRLMGLMRKRGSGETGSAGGSPSTGPSPSGTEPGAAQKVGAWMPGGSGGAGAAGGSNVSPRDAALVHNLAYVSPTGHRPSLDDQPDAYSRAEQ